MKAKERTSILGLSFEGKSMGACLMLRRGGRPKIEKRLKIPLTLDPLNGEAELVGREIRNQLDAAGIHERQCAVCLPLGWMLTLHTELPALEDEDRESYINMQAERALPFAPEDLMIGVSNVKMSDGTGLATLVAIARHSLTSLQAVFKAAGLKPVLFIPGVATLPLPDNCAVLLASDGGLDLAIRHSGGFALIRSLDEVRESGPDGVEWDYDMIARQIRISLGRLPGVVRGQIHNVIVFGAQEHVIDLVSGLREPMTAQGIGVQGAQSELAGQGLDPAQWSQAASVAALCLLGKEPVFDFLPPYVSRFKQIAGRISARGMMYLGGGGVVLLLALAVMFFMQWSELNALQAQWKAMKPRVDRIEEVQRKIRTFRPWFDPNAQSLVVAAGIAKAFPERGLSWLKSMEIKDLGTITCTGLALSNTDWLALRQALGSVPEIQDMQVLQVSAGKNGQVQFNVNFHWAGGGVNAK